MVSAKDERVLVALEELQDLKGVWVDLGKIWQNLDEMREKSWLSVAPRKIRQSLDTLLQQLKDFPSRLKQYASFEYVQRIVKTYTKVMVLMYIDVGTGVCVVRVYMIHCDDVGRRACSLQDASALRTDWRNPKGAGMF